MNLQETIRRVLMEDMEQRMIPLIKTSISSIMDSYGRICGVDILTPSENADRYYFLSKPKIPYRVLVYIVGGVDSKYWPRTQAVRNKEMGIIEKMHDTIKKFFPINVEVKIEYVKSCEDNFGSKKENMSLRESAIRTLREEFDKPSESEFKQAIKDVKSVIPIISHRIIKEMGLEHNKENIIRLNKEILQKVIEGDDEILDEMWNLAGSGVIKHAINIITYYTK